ncbi:MAG TPA: N-acetylmuramoyl-L-alanine amidase [Gemmatimonadales bacterium]|nr:N-acetylmuramoyl-L-alanine amidase [Gemmatimonadales bacterium]
MLASLLAPLVVLVQSARGEARVPVRLDPVAGPVLAAPLLLLHIGGRLTAGDGWADLKIGGRTFRLYPGAPLLLVDGAVEPIAGTAVVRGDTLDLPLQFVSEILPRALGGRFRYDVREARLRDTRLQAVAVGASGPSGVESRLRNGLHPGHVITLDAGHGGVDPGNPGLHFPRGIKEKHVTLSLTLLTRDELRRRGVGVIMTRNSDTLIELRHRGGFCRNDCDLFVSIHVNSLPRRAGFERVRGFETYFLAEARTEDAARVARMENEAIRFEGSPDRSGTGGLDFMFRDLQLNEHLRESARAAELVQSFLQESHTGPDLGVKQANFTVLTTARRPAILIEAGFSTNRDDARLLTSRTSQRNLAASMADAIVAYLLEYERKVGDGAESGGPGGRPRGR